MAIKCVSVPTSDHIYTSFPANILCSHFLCLATLRPLPFCAFINCCLQATNSDEFFLSKHPLSGLDGAGIMLQMLRRQFHSFLRTTANIMPKVGRLVFTNQCPSLMPLPIAEGLIRDQDSFKTPPPFLPPLLVPLPPLLLPLSSLPPSLPASRWLSSAVGGHAMATTCSSNPKTTPSFSRATFSPTSARRCPSPKSPPRKARIAGACGTG